jgi:uncharacterized protein
MSEYLPVKKVLIRSQVSCERLYRLRTDWLREVGIKGILIDLENTLVPYGAIRLSGEAKELLRRLMTAGLTVLVASNAAWSPVAEELRAEGIAYQFQCWKPFSFRLRNWRRINNLQGPDTLVIGDQVLTDGLMAVFSRSHLLLVTPLSRSEPAWAKTQRLIGSLVKPLLVGYNQGIDRS